MGLIHAELVGQGAQMFSSNIGLVLLPELFVYYGILVSSLLGKNYKGET
jgi:hypothetical protein